MIFRSIMKNTTLYKKYHVDRHWDSHPTVYAERFCDLLSGKDFHDRLVDLGCGSGRDVQVFADHGFDAIGIDLSESDVQIARTDHPKCRFDMMDIERLTFSDGSIGGYFMINVIHYVDQERTIDQIFRTLKVDGYLFVHFNLAIVDEDSHVDYSQDEKAIRSLVSRFEVVEEKMFTRVDTVPKKHTHTILELILKKPATGS